MQKIKYVKNNGMFDFNRARQVPAPASIVRSNKQWAGTCLYQEWFA